MWNDSKNLSLTPHKNQKRDSRSKNLEDTDFTE